MDDQSHGEGTHEDGLALHDVVVEAGAQTSVDDPRGHRRRVMSYVCLFIFVAGRLFE